MTVGKGASKYVTVQMDDSTPTLRDITPSCNSISQVGLTYESPDVTAYSDGWTNVVVGLPNAEVELGGPFNNTATTGAHIVFTGINGLMANTYTLEIRFGGRAAPTTGDPRWTGEYYCTQYTVEPGGPNDAPQWKAKLMPAGATVGAWSTVP